MILPPTILSALATVAVESSAWAETIIFSDAQPGVPKDFVSALTGNGTPRSLGGRLGCFAKGGRALAQSTREWSKMTTRSASKIQTLR
jgi:hypothetical protein